MPEKSPFPWHAAGAISLIMPTEDRLMLLTSNAQLFTLPLTHTMAHEKGYAALRPINLKV